MPIAIKIKDIIFKTMILLFHLMNWKYSESQII